MESAGQLLNEGMDSLAENLLNESLGMRQNEVCPEFFYCNAVCRDNTHALSTMDFSIHLGF